jgi:hypothetical protein
MVLLRHSLVPVANEQDATAIVFRSRRRGRLVRLLSGETATGLVTDPTVPVVSLAEHPVGADEPAHPEDVESAVRSERVEHTAETDSPGEQGDDSSTRRADSRGNR